jgi:hypothetical protein
MDRETKDKINKALSPIITLLGLGIATYIPLEYILPQMADKLEKCTGNCTIGEPMGLIPLSVLVGLAVLGIIGIRYMPGMAGRE